MATRTECSIGEEHHHLATNHLSAQQQLTGRAPPRREEIGALVEKVGMSLDISQLTVLFLSMDLDKSGLIDWKEFLAWYYSPIDESEGPTDHGRLKKKLVLQVGRAAAETSDWLLHIFKKYDSDANGALDLGEHTHGCQ